MPTTQYCCTSQTLILHFFMRWFLSHCNYHCLYPLLAIMTWSLQGTFDNYLHMFKYSFNSVPFSVFDFMDYNLAKKIVLMINLCICLSYPLNFGIYCGMSRYQTKLFLPNSPCAGNSGTPSGQLSCFPWRNLWELLAQSGKQERILTHPVLNSMLKGRDTNCLKANLRLLKSRLHP